MKITAAPSKPKKLFPITKIREAVMAIMPKNQTFKLHIAESEIGEKKIVRVVTTAWKTLPPSEKVGKVLDQINGKLTPEEEKSILRFSVLTPEEYKRVTSWSPPKIRPSARSRKTDVLSRSAD